MTRPGGDATLPPVLLAIDVGNTNTVIGVFQGMALRDHWRIETSHARTGDEYGVLIRQLFAGGGIDPSEVDAVVVSSVVPPLGRTLEEMSRRWFHQEPLFVGPGVKTGIPILYENPREVGALLVRTDDGLERVLSGDVVHLRALR